MIFEDSADSSVADTNNYNALEELMNAVDEIEEAFVCDFTETE